MEHPTVLDKSSKEVNIGISEEHREAIAESLTRLLADSYMLYLKTHNYHWNVTGKLFFQLHDQFEEQYTDLADAVDEIAERIRTLGYRAPGSFREFASLPRSLKVRIIRGPERLSAGPLLTTKP